MSSPHQLLVASLGSVPYAAALELQRAAARARLDGTLDQDLLILLEHPPVVTTGRSTKAGNLLLDARALAARGIELFDVERGGDVTFHGPGQLVGYPIIDLRRHREDLHWYLRQVEQALIDAIGTFGIPAARNPGKTGVWTRDRKIASIGVHARQWVTWHGFALNVTTDLSYFDVMVPCGIPDVVMTSIERELVEAADGPCLAPPPTLGDDAREAVVAAMAAGFGLKPEPIAEADLRAVVAAAVPPSP
ncbi:MAG: lipoyl(octanoyl) transferase LipB [Gemmatimonadota bacterium]|nr:lipoyl(octanoyl) transferase LipB [Gemmatimonadota bacterium]